MPLMMRRPSPRLREQPFMLSPRLQEVAYRDAAQVFQFLHSSPHGLTEQEAARRLAHVGTNQVIYERPPAWWMQLAKAFATPFIAVLLLLGIVSPMLSWLPLPIGTGPRCSSSS